MNLATVSLIEVCEANFEVEILKAKGPSVVLFWAPWSEPCRVLQAVMRDVISEPEAGKFRTASVNVDDNLLLSMWYTIQSIPTLICFIDGLERDRIIGTASKEAILARFRPYLACRESGEL